jgi:L-alanine-DL-glutamate epimerase-like enolase superfamily enzyme
MDKTDRRRVIGALSATGLLLSSGSAGGQAAMEAPLNRLKKEARKIAIKSVTTFDVMVPPTAPTPPTRTGGPPGRTNVTCVETVSGVRGYSFLGSTAQQIAAAQPVLVGRDLFEIEDHLKNGLIRWGGIEEAMWDAIGKIAGQPVARLLGGSTTHQPVYVTYVWPGTKGQETITPKQQAEQAKVLRAAGFRAMKIQVFRRNTQVDADACAEILAVGGRDFRVMVDRTADRSPNGLWTYDQALAAAHALEKAGCYWLEEPLARDDYEGPARLRRESKIIITGGEGYHGLEPYKQCLIHGTYEILQPELRLIAGIWTARKVGVLADAWGLKTAPHGMSGLALAGRLQVAAAMGSVYQEVAVLNPPWLPQDYCKPYLPLFYGEQPFTFEDGACRVPPYPGLGLNIDEKALAHYRVDGLQGIGPPAPPPV